MTLHDNIPTTRELECLEAVCSQGVKGAAASLFLSEHTVKNHLRNLYQKLSVSGTTEACIALGWLKFPSSKERRELNALRELYQFREKVDTLISDLLISQGNN
jgi:DNA-binding CsgD family transcriptional regulator